MVDQEARRIIAEVARAVDRRLAVEVRELPGQDRLHLLLSHGTRHGELELSRDVVRSAGESPIARNELRLRLKRANDHLLFRPMPDHRLRSVNPVPPPGGQTAPRGGRGRR